MIIRDPLYGAFEPPSFLDRLITAPEVRRLAGVRLLNAPTPSLPTLSEITRFSHTLGVLYIALQNPHVGLTKAEVRAFLASVLIHDAGTPPFAHLLEYYLNDRYGWSHESVISDLLTGHHAIENLAHQVLPGEDLRFRKLCRDASVDFNLVIDMVRERHYASRLLFGTLDFDNLDNVLRMAWALGIPADKEAFLRLARNISTDIDGRLVLPASFSREVDIWARARRQVYDILVFDEITVASQAVLTRALRLLFKERGLEDIEWLQRDSDLVEHLSSDKLTKNLMLKRFKGRLPRQLLCIQLKGTLKSLGFSSRDKAIDWIENVSEDCAAIRDPLGYVFVDRGVFSKQIQFHDPATNRVWDHGEMSESVVFYCFFDGSKRSEQHLSEKVRSAVLEALPKVLDDRA